MVRTHDRIVAGALSVAAFVLNSCVHHRNPELTAGRKELAALQAEQETMRNYRPDTYEYFVSHNSYPVNMCLYRDGELMKQATAASLVVICLEQQRGRLYVHGRVAADWPVSTGIPGRETPCGNFSVRQKVAGYASNRYGKIYNAAGKCVNSNADVFTDAVPAGGKFVGSPMPYWQRLTGDGVGMHIGNVRAGRRLSHGCIRTPREMATELYRITSVGSKVTVCRKLEPQYPCRDALAAGASHRQKDERINALRKRIAELEKQELERRGKASD